MFHTLWMMIHGWIKALTTYVTQRVIMFFSVKSVVPHSTVSGALMFLLRINDIAVNTPLTAQFVSLQATVLFSIYNLYFRGYN